MCAPPIPPWWTRECRPWPWSFTSSFQNWSRKKLPPSPAVWPGITRGLALLSYRRWHKRSGSAPLPPIPSRAGPPEVCIPHQGLTAPPHPPRYWISWVIQGLPTLNPSPSENISRETYPSSAQSSADTSRLWVVRPYLAPSRTFTEPLGIYPFPGSHTPCGCLKKLKKGIVCKSRKMLSQLGL